MHWIQREILKKLTETDSCRYTELKPANVDGNLFMYHLKQLANDGYVTNENKKYLLTKEGKRFVGGISLTKGKTTQTPKTFVMIYSKNNKDELLLYKWTRQPYRGHISLPFGRLRFGEAATKSVQENLKYKTGITGTLRNLGVCDVIVYKENIVSTHYVAHVFELKNPTGNIGSDGLTGQPFWNTIKGFKSKELVDGTEEIVKIIETKKSPFFEEILVKK